MDIPKGFDGAPSGRGPGDASGRTTGGRRVMRTTQRLRRELGVGIVGLPTPADADTKSSALEGTLFLEDGTRFDGRGIGAAGTRVGEVVFTTGMVGYPESLTDPSYRGQILAFTYPLLGNYGVPDPKARDQFGLPTNFESSELQVRATVMRGVTRPNHWASGGRLEEWLKGEEVPGVVGIDTRRLTEHLRSVGVLRGIVWAGAPGHRPEESELRKAIEDAPAYADQ